MAKHRIRVRRIRVRIFTLIIGAAKQIVQMHAISQVKTHYFIKTLQLFFSFAGCNEISSPNVCLCKTTTLPRREFGFAGLKMKTVCVWGRKLTVAAFLVGYVLTAGPIPARAGLGGDASSIEADASAMAGKMSPPASQLSASQPASTQAPSAAFSTQSFVTGNGVTVREFSAPSGPVFGVAWQGHRPPDLSVLLGSYYPEYQAAASAHKGPKGLHHDVIAGPNSVVYLTGHMGNLSGRAYAPGLVPSGVDPEAVVK